MKARRSEEVGPIREAEYYSLREDGVVECRLCPHGCRLREGQCGRCRSRVNRGGRLWTEAYGKVCALQVDPVEKKPLLHFHPGGRCLSLAAAGCNLACRNCQNWTLSQVAPSEVEGCRLAPENVVRMAVEQDCPMVAYTYTEPLTYLEYVRDCAKACRAAGLKNILVTAGYVNAEPLAELLPWLDAVNIDLKAFSDDVYRTVCHARLSPVLSALSQMRREGVWMEITNLLIPGINDDMEMVRGMCQWLEQNGFSGHPLHFSRFFPNYRMPDLPPTPLSRLVEARSVAKACGMKYVYLGNVSLQGALDTVCPSCGEVLVRRQGYQVELGTFKGVCPKCGERINGCFD